MRPDTSKPAYVIGFMVVSAAVFTGGIMTLDVSTRDLAERNRKLKVQRWIVDAYELYRAEGAEAIDALSDDQIIAVYRRRVRQVAIPAAADRQGWMQMTLYVVYATDRDLPPPPPEEQAPPPVAPEDFKNDPDLRGVVFPLQGIGFWELIEGWMAVNETFDAVEGVLFTRHGETPGLGGKITTDQQWLAQWRGLDVSAPAEPGQPYFHVTSDPDAAGEARRIDALTAATQTSNAIEDFANRNIHRFRHAMGLEES